MWSIIFRGWHLEDMNWFTTGRSHIYDIYMVIISWKRHFWKDMTWSIGERSHMSVSYVVNPTFRVVTWRDRNRSIAGRSQFSAEYVVNLLLMLVSWRDMDWSLGLGIFIIYCHLNIHEEIHLSENYVINLLLILAPWWNMNCSILGKSNVVASIAVNPLLCPVICRSLKWSLLKPCKHREIWFHGLYWQQ